MALAKHTQHTSLVICAICQKQELPCSITISIYPRHLRPAPSARTLLDHHPTCSAWHAHVHRAPKQSSNALLNFFESCPDNAFQRVQPGMPAFSVGQRFGAILRNGLKLFAVGFCASMLGV